MSCSVKCPESLDILPIVSEGFRFLGIPLEFFPFIRYLIPSIHRRRPDAHTSYCHPGLKWKDTTCGESKNTKYLGMLDDTFSNSLPNYLIEADIWTERETSELMHLYPIVGWSWQVLYWGLVSDGVSIYMLVKYPSLRLRSHSNNKKKGLIHS